MGLLDDFKQQGHLPYYGNQSRWSSEVLKETDFLRDPLGHGWHLDRMEFESWLRKKAIERGAALLAPARLAHLEWDNNKRWEIAVMHDDQRMEFQARILIDAGGRTPVIAKRLGATRIQLDNTVCSWVIGEAQINNSELGFSYVHAVPQGW